MCFSCPLGCRIWYFLANCHTNYHIFSHNFVPIFYVCVCQIKLGFQENLVGFYLSIFHSLQSQMEAHWSDTIFAQVQIFMKTSTLKYECIWFQLKMHSPDENKGNEVFNERTLKKKLCSKAMIL